MGSDPAWARPLVRFALRAGSVFKPARCAHGWAWASVMARVPAWEQVSDQAGDRVMVLAPGLVPVPVWEPALGAGRVESVSRPEPIR